MNLETNPTLLTYSLILFPLKSVAKLLREQDWVMSPYSGKNPLKLMGILLQDRVKNARSDVLNVDILSTLFQMVIFISIQNQVSFFTQLKNLKHISSERLSIQILKVPQGALTYSHFKAGQLKELYRTCSNSLHMNNRLARGRFLSLP